MSWHDVLDQKLDLYNFWRSEYAMNAAESFVEGNPQEAARGIAFETPAGRDESPPGMSPAELIVGQELVKIFRADPIYVDDKMMTLLEAASEGFQPEPLHEFDLVTQFGFVVLPRCFTFQDKHDKAITIRAFSWMPAHFYEGDFDNVKSTGISLSLYSHVQDLKDGKDGYSDTWQPGELDKLAAMAGTPFVFAHQTPWRYGEEFPKGIAEYVRWWKHVQAFFRLTQQTIGGRYQQKAPRASLRRWQRSTKHPHHEPYITVIRLRRPKGQHSESESSVDWHHQWIVGGHWRNQWYPSLGVHRQIYISEHVKGPEDKPLLVRKGRAFELVR